MNPLQKLNWLQEKLHQEIRSPVRWKKRRIKKWCRAFNSRVFKMIRRKRGWQ